MTHPMHALELDHVTLALGGRTILRDVSFAVESGEFVGVLGPNGAGKTTLMRAVLGLVPAHSGAIRVAGEPVARGNPAIGYMPQLRSALAGRRVRGRAIVAGGAGAARGRTRSRAGAFGRHRPHSAACRVLVRYAPPSSRAALAGASHRPITPSAS